MVINPHGPVPDPGFVVSQNLTTDYENFIFEKVRLNLRVGLYWLTAHRRLTVENEIAIKRT